MIMKESDRDGCRGLEWAQAQATVTPVAESKWIGDRDESGRGVVSASRMSGSQEKDSEGHGDGHETVDVDSSLNDAEDTFPDGGLRAWMVVVGCACTIFATFGFVNAWGVFQTYYEETLLTNTNSSQIAWIGSLQYALVFFPAVFVGRIFDLGYLRVPFFIGSLGVVGSTFIIAQCYKYWHFILVQGILVGLSCGACFGPVIGVLGHWFDKRRGFAVSLSAMGASLGGTVIPIVARALIPKVGFPWTMRILGFILMFTLGIANLTLKRRLPPKNVAGGIFNLKAFKNPAFAVYCSSTLASFLGIYTLLTFIGVSATDVGIDPGFAFYLVAIANAFSGLGRFSVGLAIDKTGAVNVSAPAMIGAALVTYLWPLAKTKSVYIAIAAIYGFTSAPYVATFQFPLYSLGAIEDVGRRAGMTMTCAAFGALAGPPISGAIYRSTGNFSAVGYYAGSMILLSCSLTLLTRYLVLKQIWGKF